MNPEFSSSPVTTSGISFEKIQRAIDYVLLTRQQFLQNFGSKLWQSLDPSFLAATKTNELQKQQILNPVTLKENLPEFTPIFPDEGIQEFKKIILEDYGIELSDQQAYEDATAFLGAFKSLTDIDTLRKEHGNVS